MNRNLNAIPKASENEEAERGTIIAREVEANKKGQSGKLAVVAGIVAGNYSSDVANLVAEVADLVSDAPKPVPDIDHLTFPLPGTGLGGPNTIEPLLVGGAFAFLFGIGIGGDDVEVVAVATVATTTVVARAVASGVAWVHHLGLDGGGGQRRRRSVVIVREKKMMRYLSARSEMERSATSKKK